MATGNKILYIDDDDDVREVASLSLSLDADLEVRTSSSGREGIALAAEWKPDLVLLDVMMPEMDGPETLKHIKADPELASIPVVFITARAQVHEVHELRAIGAAGVISKPFDPMTLAAEVRQFLG
ncbi:response regulator [Devosia pacifica]|uniref:Response regulator n=1 Tax=Devosia pacifica TaxID=1335967 RepID=A0A918SD26_9HYPH|nr:response regulator [Devosia pacifica]GHA32754.1 response regulator [Devosia pacifica]